MLSFCLGKSRVIAMPGEEIKISASAIAFADILGFWGLMVRERRLELLRAKALDPKSSASTNSATLAHHTTLLPV